MPFTPTNPLAELPVNLNALIFAASVAGGYHPSPNHEYLSLILHVFMARIGVISPLTYQIFSKRKGHWFLCLLLSFVPFEL